MGGFAVVGMMRETRSPSPEAVRRGWGFSGPAASMERVEGMS